MDFHRLRAWFRGQLGEPPNPFDILTIAMQFAVNVEFCRESRYVSVDENEGGLVAHGGVLLPCGAGLTTGEKAVAELRILLDPDEWRRSERYRKWRLRQTEIFQ